MLELEILGFNIALPLIIMTCALVAAKVLREKSVDAPEKQSKSTSDGGGVMRRSIPVVAAIASLWLAFGLRVDFALWPEDAWARIPQVSAFIGLATLGTMYMKLGPVAWIIRATAYSVATFTVIPSGEAWEFLNETRHVWWLCLFLTGLGAWWLIGAFEGRIAAALGFGWIGCLIGIAFLTKDFLRVTEPLLAVSTILGCCSIAAWRSKQASSLRDVSGLCLIASATSVASAQFNSFAGLPDALSWYALSTPLLLTLLCYPLALMTRRRMDNEGEETNQTSTKLPRLALPLLILLTVLVSGSLILWTAFENGDFSESSGEDEWGYRSTANSLAG